MSSAMGHMTCIGRWGQVAATGGDPLCLFPANPPTPRFDPASTAWFRRKDPTPGPHVFHAITRYMKHQAHLN